MSLAAALAATEVRCVCGCADPHGAAAHAIAAALAADDLDGAIDAGLLREDFACMLVCGQCTPACARISLDARDARLRALAARERYRARSQRLQRRADERAAQRAPAPAAATTTDDIGNKTTGLDGASASDSAHAPPPPPRPALPSAAAAALARAKAKAAQRGPT